MYKVKKSSSQTEGKMNSVYMKYPTTKYVKILGGSHEGFFSTKQKEMSETDVEIPDYFRKFMQTKLDDSVVIVDVSEETLQNITGETINFNIRLLGSSNPTDREVNTDAKLLGSYLEGVIMQEKCEYYFEGKHKYLAKCEYISNGKDIAFIQNFTFTYSPRVESSYPVASYASSSRRSAEPQRIATQSNYKADSSLFNGDFDFEKMGIGGQGEAFKLIFRNAFAPYLLEEESKSMGSTHIKGILLYGPPGCGKTLIARQLAKCVNAKTFKIINGPEIKDKYVGESERYIRELFKDAEECKQRGEPGIHVIVFDEFDSIGSKRTEGGNSCSNMSNDIVNQLLSKIEGVDSLDNILIIGMTNRLSAIDPALLRSGRLELHIEITVPNKAGRLEILNIHSKDLVTNKHLDPDVNFDEIAELTVNYSGAEIKALINKASTYPMVRLIDPVTMKKVSKSKPIVTRNDFLLAIHEIIPVMGTSSRDVQIITKHPISLEDDNFRRIYNNIKDNLIEFFTGVPIFIGTQRFIGRNFSILLIGEPYSGKTKMIAHIVSELSQYISHLRFINPEHYVNNSSSLWKEFEEGKRTNNFLMVIDSLETILESSIISKEIRDLKTILGCNIEGEKMISTIVTCSDRQLIASLKLENKFMRVYDMEDKEYIE